MKLFRTNTLGHIAFNWLMTSSDICLMTSLREKLDHVRGGDYDDQTVVWSRAAKCFLKCENLRFLGLGFVISYLTSHFGQYKRNIKRRQANIDLQAIGSDTP